MPSRPPIDLRSDTVTQPDPAMRQAIANAEVGDDVLGHDPTVERLERTIAERLGKEAALFVPSGTMANQISVRAHAPSGSEVILDRGSHVLNFEAGASMALWGVGFFPIDAPHGILAPDAVRTAFRPPVPHLPQSSLLWLENTHNMAGGVVWPLERLEAVAAAGRELGLPVHLDGARIWNAAVASGEESALIARCADSVSVCMSKGLGAPVGSLVVGSASFIEDCWVIRKQMGGGMRQSGVLAAAALHGLEHNFAKLADDHANAYRFATRLNECPGVSVDLDATQTNIVVFDIAKTGRDPLEFARTSEAQGVLLVPFGGTRLRAVTHLDVSRDDVDRAANILVEVLSATPAPSGGQ